MSRTGRRRTPGSFRIFESNALRQQGKGYGRKAAELAVYILKSANPEKKIKLATEQCNLKAQSLYHSLGFAQLPELDGDDLVFGL